MIYKERVPRQFYIIYSNSDTCLSNERIRPRTQYLFKWLIARKGSITTPKRIFVNTMILLLVISYSQPTSRKKDTESAMDKIILKLFDHVHEST